MESAPRGSTLCGPKQSLTTSGILVQNAIWREENRSPLIGGTSRDDWLTPSDNLWRLNQNVFKQRQS